MINLAIANGDWVLHICSYFIPNMCHGRLQIRVNIQEPAHEQLQRGWVEGPIKKGTTG